MIKVFYLKIFLAGLGFLFIGSGLFLTLPRILGKMIDEFDTSKKPKDENNLNSFSIIQIKNKDEEDFLGKMARYLRNNPWALGVIIALGACAISARIYLMHTTSLFVFLILL
jgi:hypothetical protein